MEFKCRHLKEFLLQGHKVKATVIFIGRMMVHQELGKRLLDQVLEKLLEVGKIEQPPKMEGRFMTAMLIPDKKKVEDHKRSLQKQKEIVNIK
jgi:translation initiation factor IF-3